MITAGNSSGINDAASALAISSDAYAEKAGLVPTTKIHRWAAIGIDPNLTRLAVIDAIRKRLDRPGRNLADVELWEINEAFASVPIAACKSLALDEGTVNILRSGCTPGHSVAASGGRNLATLINNLKRRGGGLGVADMSAGGGQAGAVLIEV